MADNLVANAGAGGATFRTDELPGPIHVPYTKILLGGDGVDAGGAPGDATNGIDVDVTRVIPGVTATALGKAEDAAAGSGDTGVMILGVRNDAGAVLTDADGDYNAIRVTGEGHMVTVPRGIQAHDGALTSGPGSPLIIGGWASAAAPTDVSADGDAVRAWFLRNGQQVIQPAFGGTLASTGNGVVGAGVQRVAIASDNTAFTVNAAQSGTWNIGSIAGAITPGTGATNLGKAEDAGHTTGDVGVMALAVRNSTLASVTNADADYSPISVNDQGEVFTASEGIIAHDAAIGSVRPQLIGGFASAAAPADVSADGDAANAWLLRNGAQVVSIQSGGAIAGVSGTRLQVQAGGVDAHDAAVSSNPLRIAAKANLNEPTAVSADADAVDIWADRLGRVVTLVGHSNPEAPVSVNATTNGNNTIISAPGASLSLYIQKASVHNRNSANILVALQDGAGGTTMWRAELPAEGGGSLIDFGSRGWKLTANTLLNMATSAATDVDVNITEYYIAA